MADEFLLEAIREGLKEEKGNRQAVELKLAPLYRQILEQDDTSRFAAERMKRMNPRYDDATILHSFVEQGYTESGLGNFPEIPKGQYFENVPTSNGEIYREDPSESFSRRSHLRSILGQQRSARAFARNTEALAPILDKNQDLQEAFGELTGQNYGELKQKILENKDLAGKGKGLLGVFGVLNLPSKVITSILSNERRGFAVEIPGTGTQISDSDLPTGFDRRALIGELKYKGQYKNPDYLYTENPFIAMAISGKFKEQGDKADLSALQEFIVPLAKQQKKDQGLNTIGIDLGGGIYRTTSPKTFIETATRLGETLVSYGMTDKVPSFSDNVEISTGSKAAGAIIGGLADITLFGALAGIKKAGALGAIEGAATAIPESIDLVKNIGVRLAGVSPKVAEGAKIVEKLKPAFQASIPEIDSAIREAQKGIEVAAKEGPSFVEQVKQSLLRGAMRHLPRGEFGEVREELLSFQKSRGTASILVQGNMQATLKGLSPEATDVFQWGILYGDLSNDLMNGLPQVPFYKSNFPALLQDMSEFQKVLKEYPDAAKSIQTRLKQYNVIQESYLDNVGEFIPGLAERFAKHPNYLRHQVLEYAQYDNAMRKGGFSLKAPVGRSFQMGRKGTGLPINANILQADWITQNQLLRDTQAGRVLKAAKKYDISENISKVVGFSKEKEFGPIPKGYVEFQPYNNPRIFYQAHSIPERFALEAMELQMQAANVPTDTIKNVLAVGGERKPWIIPENLANQLNESLTIEEKILPKAFGEALANGWKTWRLTAPHNVGNYNLGNLTSDVGTLISADPTFFLKPKNWKHIGESLKEMWPIMSGDFSALEKNPVSNEYAKRGGIFQSSRVAELNDLGKISEFSKVFQKASEFTEADVELLAPLWRQLRLTTDYRESILRYSAFKRSLDDIAVNGKPTWFGASDPAEVASLTNKYDQAFKISQDTMGRFDDISPTTQALRKNWMPFASWKEVNLKIHSQLIKNAKMDYDSARSILEAHGVMKLPPAVQLGADIAAQVTGSAIKAAGLAVKLSGAYGIMQAYNNTFFPEEEKALGDRRWFPHVTFGKDDKGRTVVFPIQNAIYDLLTPLGARVAPRYLDEWSAGKMNTGTLLKEFIGKEPLNWLAQGINPFAKETVEQIFDQSLFPSIFDRRSLRGGIRYRGERAFRLFSAAPLYRNLTGIPDEDMSTQIANTFMSRYDPGQLDYYAILDKIRRYQNEIGKSSQSFYDSPKGRAFLMMNQALKFDAPDLAKSYLKQYVMAGGSGQGLEGSVRSGIPLSHLDLKDVRGFKETLTNDEEKILIRANQWYLKTVQDRFSAMRALFKEEK